MQTNELNLVNSNHCRKLYLFPFPTEADVKRRQAGIPSFAPIHGSNAAKVFLDFTPLLSYRVEFPAMIRSLTNMVLPAGIEPTSEPYKDPASPLMLREHFFFLANIHSSNIRLTFLS